MALGDSRRDIPCTSGGDDWSKLGGGGGGGGKRAFWEFSRPLDSGQQHLEIAVYVRSK